MNQTKQARKYYAVQQIGREAHVYIYGDIVTWKLFDDETSAYSFKEEIEALDVDVIHVHINSYGGAVSEGWTIYNALREHPARIVTHADGFVASAAIYPFMSGEERIASTLSAFFFHQVLVSTTGNADELRAAADEADKLNEIGLNAFTDNGVDAERVRELEQAETWLDAQEALELGIATAIMADETPREMQSIKRDIIQRMTRKMPEQTGGLRGDGDWTAPTPAPLVSMPVECGSGEARAVQQTAAPEAAAQKQGKSVMALYKNLKF